MLNQGTITAGRLDFTRPNGAQIDLASADSESEIKDKVWFDTAKFPVAHFASTSIKNVGGDKYEIAGKLTLKGITKDVLR